MSSGCVNEEASVAPQCLPGDASQRPKQRSRHRRHKDHDEPTQPEERAESFPDVQQEKLQHKVFQQRSQSYKQRKVKSDDPIADLIDEEEIVVRKRLARIMPRRSNDVYITLKTNFKAQLDRCQRLLDNQLSRATTSSSPHCNNDNPDEAVVWLHGLGAAQSRAINLALQLETVLYPGQVRLAAHTGSVQCWDEVLPRGNNSELTERKRYQSAVHIMVSVPSYSRTTSGATPATAGLAASAPQ